MTSLATLKKTALRLLKEYRSAEDEARTPIARRLAETLVEAREHFTDAEGETDWRGRTYPYRQWVREIYDDANLRGEDGKRVQAAIRYHIGAALRARLSDEERERLGLMPQSPRERSGERRATRSAVLNALNSREVAGGALLALTALKAIAQRIDADEVAGLDESAQAVAKATITDLERQLRALKKRLD
jgi:hypothetical protein